MIDDIDPCTWLGTETRKARKAHRCDECRREIQAGESYARSTYVMDGDLRVNKACAHCDATRAWLTKHCGGWVTEHLLEELQEHHSEGYREDRLARLIVGVRRNWRRFDGAGLMAVPNVTTAAATS
jgi:hypothetical protein